jgi:hypothetical protein
MDQAAEQQELQQPSDHLLRDGLIWAFVVPIVGVIWAARLFINDRLSEAFLVLMTAIAVVGVYILILQPFGSSSSYSAYSSNVQSQVEQTIKERVQQHSSSFEKDQIKELSCVAQSASIMKCSVAAEEGPYYDAREGHVIYEVTIDQSDGHFLVGAPVNIP